MRIKYTDGQDQDFQMLSEKLDQEYMERYGDIALQYRQYHTWKDIKTAAVLYFEQRPVACSSYKEFDFHTVEIRRVYVLKEFRRKGLSRKIMEACEEEAKRRGYQYAVLETRADAKESIFLYESMGYQIIPNFAPFEGDLLSTCMKKKL